MGLRWKILAGFLILSLMLVLAGGWAIYHLNALGTTVQRMLDDNYRSIQAAESMLDALERQDSGILLLLLGDRENGRGILEDGDRAFSEHYARALGNATIPGEPSFLDQLKERYGRYKALWTEPVVGTRKEGDLDWYSKEVHAAFLDAKAAAGDLLQLNSRELYRTASQLKERARRAAMPGVVAMTAALVFSFLFSYLVNRFVVSPLIRAREGLDSFNRTGRPFEVEAESKDEIGRLIEEVRRTTLRVRRPEADA